MLAATAKNAHTVQSGLREAEEATRRAVSLASGAMGIEIQLSQGGIDGRVRTSDAPLLEVPFVGSVSAGKQSIKRCESDLDAYRVTDILSNSVAFALHGDARPRHAPTHLVLDPHFTNTK